MAAHESHAGDRELISRWAREHGSAVRGYLLGLVKRVDVAEDLLQEVFRRAWEARNRYQERGQERAYLLRIADHLACDRARRDGREITVGDETWREIEPAEDAPHPAASLMGQESRDELNLALAGLSPLQRRVLFLRFYGEMDFAEIAAVIGCPLSTALSHARRGLLALRKTLAENTR